MTHRRLKINKQTNRCFSLSKVLLEVPSDVSKTSSIAVSKWIIIWKVTYLLGWERAHDKQLRQVGGSYHEGGRHLTMLDWPDQPWISIVWHIPSKITRMPAMPYQDRCKSFMMLYSSHSVSTFIRLNENWCRSVSHECNLNETW